MTAPYLKKTAHEETIISIGLIVYFVLRYAASNETIQFG
jgi:hypothetical protein